MTPLPEASLQRLWDEACIRRLPIEYADSILVKDEERMYSLWALDLPPVEAPDFDIHWARKLPARWQNWGVTMLHVTTHAIVFDGPDAAHGRVQCIVQMERDGEMIDQSVLYEDGYLRTDGGWVFSIRRHQLWFGQARSENPLLQQRSEWPLSHVGLGTVPDDVRRLAGESE